MRVAATDLTVLVTGESGVGKEFFPQIIHAHSARKHDKYVAVNGVAWQIPRGKKWKVPMKVARMLERAEAAADTADKFSDEEQKKMAIIQGL